MTFNHFMSFSLPLRLQSVVGNNRENGVQDDDPYFQFLAGQHKRELEWKAVREAKRRKVQSAVQMTLEKKTLYADSVNAVEISGAVDGEMKRNKLTMTDVPRPVKVSTLHYSKR